MTVALAAGAALVVVLVLRPARPPAPRLRAELRPAPVTMLSAGPRPARRAVARLGVATASLLTLAVWPPGFVALLAWLALRPALRRRRGQRRYHREVARHLPDTVDLLSLAIGAGQTTRQAVGTVAGCAAPPFAAAFAEVKRRADRGERVVEALAALTERLGAAVQPVVSVLVALERQGVAIGATLEQLSVEARRERRLQAEMAARRLPVRLSFPLVCCVLPAFALLTLAPLLAGALSSLHL